MSYADDYQWTTISAVLAKLQLDLGLDDAACFFTLDPFPPYSAPNDIFVTVTLGPGSFAGDLGEGGGENQTEESYPVIISINSRIMLDQAGHDNDAMLHATLGIFRTKRAILKSIAWQDLVNGDGNRFLRDGGLEPISASTPQKLPENIIQAQIVFQASQDWELLS